MDHLTKKEKREKIRLKKQCVDVFLQGVVQIALTLPALHVSLLAAAIVYAEYPRIGEERTAALWQATAVAIVLAVMATGVIFFLQYKYPYHITKTILWIVLLVAWLPAASLGQWAGNESYLWAHPEPGEDRTFAVGMGLIITTTISLVTVVGAIYLERRLNKQYSQEEKRIRNTWENKQTRVIHHRRSSLTERSVSSMILPPPPSVDASNRPVVQQTLNNLSEPSLPGQALSSFMTAGRVRVSDLEGS
jgi:hypothetical protein